MSRTIFYGPKDVWAIKVQLYLGFNKKILICFVVFEKWSSDFFSFSLSFFFNLFIYLFIILKIYNWK